MTRRISSRAGNNSCDVNGNLTAGITSAFHLLWGHKTMRGTVEARKKRKKEDWAVNEKRLFFRHG